MFQPENFTLYQGVLSVLQGLAIASLIFISGLSLCLSTWVIPNTYLVPPDMQLRQFTATFTRGAKFIMPAGRFIMANLVITTFLTAFNPDPVISARWTSWAAMSGVMILAAPYEIFFIFPINDRAIELGKQVEKDKVSLKPRQEAEVGELVSKWALMNYGRVVLPLVAGLIGLFKG